MTQSEIDFVLKYKDVHQIAKYTAKELQMIWNKYNPTQQSHHCMCSSVERTNFKVKFFVWFNENYLQSNDSADTQQ